MLDGLPQLLLNGNDEELRLKSLLVYLKKYRLECVLAPLFKLTEALLELLVPLVMAELIDRGIAGQNAPLIWRMGLRLALLAAVGLGFSVVAQYFSAKAATGFTFELKAALMRHIQRLSYRQIDEQSVPTLITRMTGDMNQVQTGVNLTLRLLLRSPLVVFGAMVMAFRVDAPSAVVFAVLIPALGLAVYGIMRVTLPGYRRVQRASDETLARVRESLTGVRVIRAFSRQAYEEERFADTHARLSGLQLRVQRVSAALNPLTLVMVNAGLAVLLYTGGVRVNIGQLTQGQVVALANYMSQILVELLKLANLLTTISRSLACADRIAEVLRVTPDMPDGEAEPDLGASPLIEFRNAGLSYTGKGKEAVRHLNLSLKPGESLGIIGGTGSGKSSAAALIARLYDATEGAVLVGGQDVRRLRLSALRGAVGYVPQKAQLFSGTVRDNLTLGRSVSDEALWEALDTAQAADFVRALPEGLDAPVQQDGRNFSGGQRQRLTIARALVGRTPILILDDSASALDAQTDARLRRALDARLPGTAKVIISQRASSVMRLDRILVLENGEPVGLGTHEQLMRTCPVYIETYRAQFPEEVSAE